MDAKEEGDEDRGLLIMDRESRMRKRFAGRLCTSVKKRPLICVDLWGQRSLPLRKQLLIWLLLSRSLLSSLETSD
jgi:hypothetical protein